MCYERRDPEQARACFERDQMKDDYISRKALIAEYDRVHVGPAGGARKLIEEAPAVDVQTVTHGRWIPKDSRNPFCWRNCSECGHAVTAAQARVYKGCPKCLARMDGE